MVEIRVTAFRGQDHTSRGYANAPTCTTANKGAFVKATSVVEKFIHLVESYAQRGHPHSVTYAQDLSYFVPSYQPIRKVGTSSNVPFFQSPFHQTAILANRERNSQDLLFGLHFPALSQTTSNLVPSGLLYSLQIHPSGPSRYLSQNGTKRSREGIKL